MSVFPAIRMEGGLLGPDILEQLFSGKLPRQKPQDFGLDGRRSLTDDIAAVFADARAQWEVFRRRLERLPENDPATSITRDAWVIPFLSLLGYELCYNPRAYEVDGLSFAISHRAGENEDAPPVHIVGARQDLGRVAPTGRPRLAPHSLVQEFLNRTEHLWGLVTNGEVLRLLRNSTYIRRQAYLEFDLRQIFEEQRFQDFAVLYRLLHRTRLPRSAEDARNCLLEHYYQQALEQGGRVRERLRNGVEEAIKRLADGFLAHPANGELQQRILAPADAAHRLSPEELYRQLLRLVYRFLFLLVSEDRGLISVDPIYREHYGVGRLRRYLDRRSAYTDHEDLWCSLKVLWQVLADERLASMLGAAPLNGELFEPLALDACTITNRHLLEAFWHLAYYRDTSSSPPRRVNYAALDVEELGSVYESLLDYHPQIDTSGSVPRFELAYGSERKATGSYYTPPELVAELIRSALEPVLKERLSQAKTKEEQEQAILSLRVLDPAAGSGHFLLAAARRLGKELARIRTGEDEPAPERVREAIRDVVSHCIYGVDKNPLAVELCRVALWLEAHCAGKPLTFLDHRIRCGDSLVGVVDLEVLRQGIPDEAFAPASADDRSVASLLKRRNRAERRALASGQQRLPFVPQAILPDLARQEAAVEAISDDSPELVRQKKQQYTSHQQDPQRWKLLQACHLWTAAFFQRLEDSRAPNVITTHTVPDYLEDRAHPQVAAQAEALASQHRFFHWPLEFAEVFLPSPSGRGTGGKGSPSPSGRGVRGEGASPSPSGRGQGEGSNHPHQPLPPDLLDFARQLRREQTDAEKLLWSLLRSRQFGGWKFRRQHPLPPYVLDFFCHELQLAIELDGGQHNVAEARRHDEQRTKFLADKGIKVLRFWNHEVLQDTEAVLEAIWQEATRRAKAPSPLSPLPKGEGKTPSPCPLPKGEGLGGGFDVVLGNPPWERIKLQKQEFFASRDLRIAEAPNADARKRLIAALPQENPELWQAYREALHAAESESRFLRGSGFYPLTGRGDINTYSTYSVFAERMRALLKPGGRLGIIVPTGIATDDTNKHFFAAVVSQGELLTLYGFDNRKKLFPDVGTMITFSLLTLRKADEPLASAPAEFAFFCHEAADLADPERRFTLAPEDFRLLNPNTRTAPIFRSRRDAELTKHIYRRVPVLINEALTLPSPEGKGNTAIPPSLTGRGEKSSLSLWERVGVRGEGGNPWQVEFLAMFHMANDSGLFRTRAELEAEGFRLEGNVFLPPAPSRSTSLTLPSPRGRGVGGDELPSPRGRGVGGEGQRYLPLYEAKMVHQFDHRFGDYAMQPEGSKDTQLPDVPLEGLADPHYRVLPRYWVPEEEVEARLRAKGWSRGWLLGWRDICRSTDERTVIAAVIPRVGVGDKFLIMFSGKPEHAPLLLAILDSLCFDYSARQKLGGTSLKYFTMKQLPVLPPSAFDQPLPFPPQSPRMRGEGGQAAHSPFVPRHSPPTVADFVRPRVLELTYTAWDLKPFAEDLGYHGPPFRYDPERRFWLRAELDALFFYLYLGTAEEWEREASLELKALFPTPREAVAYILDQFPIVRRRDEERYGEYRTKRIILEIYDAMAEARRTGKPWMSKLNSEAAYEP